MSSSPASSVQQPFLQASAPSAAAEKETEEKPKRWGMCMLVMIMLLQRVVFGVSVVVYFQGLSSDSKFYETQINMVANNRLGFLCIGGGVFSLLVSWLNLLPSAIKPPEYFTNIDKEHKGHVLRNQLIYKIIPKPNEPQYVVMEEDEDKPEAARYNRAHQSMSHFSENVASIVLNILLASAVFPVPTMVCVIIFAVGRGMHQWGYAFDNKFLHGAGLLLFMVAALVMEGFVWITALVSLTNPPGDWGLKALYLPVVAGMVAVGAIFGGAVTEVIAGHSRAHSQ